MKPGQEQKTDKAAAVSKNESKRMNEKIIGRESIYSKKGDDEEYVIVKL